MGFSIAVHLRRPLLEQVRGREHERGLERMEAVGAQRGRRRHGLARGRVDERDGDDRLAVANLLMEVWMV